MTPLAAVLDAWPGSAIIGPLKGGARSQLFLLDHAGGKRVARWGTESEASRRWLERVQALARRAGFDCPGSIATTSGSLGRGGWSVEPFLEGAKATRDDMARLRPLLERFHRAGRAIPDRPHHPPPATAPSVPGVPRQVAARCRAHLPKGQRSAIHGDLHPGNVLIRATGQPALLDWEEARRDSPLFDLAALRPDMPPLQLAYEVLACWEHEPDRARSLFRKVPAGKPVVNLNK